MSLFQEPREMARLKCLQDNFAGLWLDCAPKSEMHKIAKDETRVALTVRLYLHQKCVIPGATAGKARARSLSTAMEYI